MRIRQHGSKVLACTATSGGEADDEDDEDGPFYYIFLVLTELT